jgi:hypothetical protein
MTALDDLIPAPHLAELDQVDVAAGAGVIWPRVRHGALAQAWPIRALFFVRSVLMPGAEGTSPTIRMDDLRSSRERPGFQILADQAPQEFAVGAIGKVWKLQIPFVHVENVRDYAAFRDPGFVKVAWALRVVPLGADACRVSVEVRVMATDEPSWRKFRRYFLLIGPFSRYIRRSLLRTIALEAGGHSDGRSVPRVRHVTGHPGG